MRRVVVTGMGIVSPLGNRLERVAAALRAGRSGISAVEDYARLGFRSQVAGVPDLSELPPINRKLRRFMGDGAVYAYHAMQRSLADSGLDASDLPNPRTGLIAGSGVGSNASHIEAIDVLRLKGASKVSPYVVPRVMSNTISASLSTAFHIQGVCYSITSACATSAHCIGHGMQLIAGGIQDVMFVGGAEELCWQNTVGFDAMGVLSYTYNATPEKASRPYDRNRDGFVIAGGAGILVLEELSHALARGADIIAELVGYGACSDGQDMVTPSHDGAARVMRLALQSVEARVDYINTHATATPAGDIVEVRAMQEVFGDALPSFSSTKGLTGHSIGAAGVHEAIYCLLMMREGFLAGAVNVEQPDPVLAGLPLLRESVSCRADIIMSNSFGFGGTNASLVFRRFNG